MGGEDGMRNITRCDICLKEKSMSSPRIADGFSLIEGRDFCKECAIKYRKKLNKLLAEMIEEEQSTGETK